MSKIKNALISVFDKEKLSIVLKVLKKNKINIISSGGTYKKIKKLGFRCKDVGVHIKAAYILIFFSFKSFNFLIILTDFLSGF